MTGARMRLGLFLCMLLVLSAVMMGLLLMTRYGLWPHR